MSQGQVGMPRQYFQLPQVGRDYAVPPPQVLPQAGSDIVPKIPRALDLSTILVGGTAVVAVTGPIYGGFLTNPFSAAAQGVPTAENLYIDMVGVPGATDATANGTTVLLQPGQNFTFPWLAVGVLVRINAATSGHRVSGEVW
jgi:hypothetical protein